MQLIYYINFFPFTLQFQRLSERKHEQTLALMQPALHRYSTYHNAYAEKTQKNSKYIAEVVFVQSLLKSSNYLVGPEFVTQFMDTIHFVPQKNLHHILGLSGSLSNGKVR